MRSVISQPRVLLARILAHSLAIALLFLASCGGDRERDAEPALPILTIGPADVEGAGPFHLPSAVARAGARARPVGGEDHRPLRLLRVLAVDLLEVESDRGHEIVRIHGLGGPGPHHPEELDLWLREVARGELERWLDEPGARLVETSLPVYGEAGAAAGPCFSDADGRRLITLRRLNGGLDLDLRETALQRGWSYSEDPYRGRRSLDPRLAFSAPEDERAGLYRLASVQAMRSAFEVDEAAVRDIDAGELQVLGDELHRALARWLGWEPATALEFRAVLPAEALELYTELITRWQAAAQELAEQQVQAQRELGVSLRIELRLPDPLEYAEELVRRQNAFSPAGPTIYVLRKERLTRPLLEQVLVHEIVHQYQEEVLLEGRLFPPFLAPSPWIEAHAEWTAARFMADRRGDPEDIVLIAYTSETRRFAALCQALGVNPDELLLRFRDGVHDNDLGVRLRRHQISVQEWLFREAGHTRFDGLEMRPLADPEGRPLVELRNTAASPFRGQFHGTWLYTLETEEGPGTGTLTGTPFNLELEPESTLRLLLGNEPHWREHPPIALTGLFSRTPAAPGGEGPR